MRWRIAGYAVGAAFAGGVGVFAGQEVQAAWGRWAAGGYLLAALITLLWRAREAATVVAFGGAVVAPLVWMVTGGRDMSTVGTGALTVVKRAGRLLLETGSPYLPVDRLTGPESLNPYGPPLTIFGLPHALGLDGWAGNPRTWFGLTAALLGYAALRHLRADRAGWRLTAAFASPMLALPLILGGTDLPVLGLIALGIALLARGAHLWLAGVVLGVACAMKVTAAPALLVLLPMLLARGGWRPALTVAGSGLLAALGSAAVTAPAMLADPHDLVHNMVLFPLRLTPQQTTAASPMPGQVVATGESGGKVMMIAFLLVLMAGICVYLWRRPARDVPAAVLQMAVIWTLVFSLAPSTRFGYFVYPLVVLGLRPSVRSGSGSMD
ncbi:glycosyltransferase family 87 protein [Catenuloplanes japonicus]|uniref:glycosyltransferase family 87 protein n=1 Tax=Catenuloplanes japonicus TaxID=33876 RepID=UPI00068D5D09|nr:glycosyltransferase family 87 protein [Catenuloplanes japonicus]